MSRGVFVKVLERLKEIDYSCIVDYSLYNEPLLDERLPEFVKLTKEALPKSIVRIYTSGDYLVPELAQTLIDAGVSVFSVTQHDRDEKVFMRKMQPLINQFPGHIMLNCLHDVPLCNRGGAIEVENPQIIDKCPTADGNLTITYTGDVLLCCNDYFRQHVFGNIMEESIRDIRKKENFSRIRKEVRKGIVKLDICKRCFSGNQADSKKTKHGGHIKNFHVAC